MDKTALTAVYTYASGVMLSEMAEVIGEDHKELDAYLVKMYDALQEAYNKEGKGLEVVDLGTDVAPETFVNAAIEQNCQVICCSALLTTTMDVMGDVVKAAEK